MSGSAIDQIYSILKYQGWIFDPKWSLQRKIVHGFFGLATLSSLVVPSVIRVLQLPQEIRDEDTGSIFYTLAVCPALLIVAFNILILIFFESKVKAFQNALEETETIAFEHSAAASVNDYHRECHHSVILLHVYLLALSGLYACIVLSPILPLISSPTINYERSATPLSDFNYGLNKTTFFWHIYAFESLQALIVGFDYLASYSIILVICILVTAQFSLLVGKVEAPTVIAESGANDLVASTSNVEKYITDCDKIDMSKLKSCITHHQYVLRLMTRAKLILKPFLFTYVILTFADAGNSVVLSLMEGSAQRKLIAVPNALVQFVSLAILIWCLVDLRNMRFKVSYMFYSLAMNVNQPGLRKECLIVMLRSNCEESFPCYITSSLSFRFFSKMVQMILNYFSFSKSMIQKSPVE